MGAIEETVIDLATVSCDWQNGAIHVYKNGEFIEEVHFTFSEKNPELDQIQQLVDKYCEEKGI